MVEWMLRELNKVDRPFQLLVMYERRGERMTIRKIKQEGVMTVSIREELARIPKLSKARQANRLVELPYRVEAKVKKQLGIKGSLPYEIRGWVSTAIFSSLHRLEHEESVDPGSNR